MDPLLVQEVFMGNVMSAGLGQVRHLVRKHLVGQCLHQSTAAATCQQETHLYLAYCVSSMG